MTKEFQEILERHKNLIYHFGMEIDGDEERAKQKGWSNRFIKKKREMLELIADFHSAVIKEMNINYSAQEDVKMQRDLYMLSTNKKTSWQDMAIEKGWPLPLFKWAVAMDNADNAVELKLSELDNNLELSKTKLTEALNNLNDD